MTDINQYTNLFTEISQLIKESKKQGAVTVNSTMSLLYWEIGNRINKEIEIFSYEESYGKKIVATLCTQLEKEYGKSFS